MKNVLFITKIVSVYSKEKKNIDLFKRNNSYLKFLLGFVVLFSFGRGNLPIPKYFNSNPNS